MKRLVTLLVSLSTWPLLLAPPALAAKCPTDSVKVGNICVDTYEASVWEIPASETALINKVKKGTAMLANLTADGVQRGVGTANDYPCSPNGNDCNTIYAVSIAGVKPSANLTWFQAQQACGNAGKRLLRNGEWQMAAAGTPDPGTDNDSTDCNITNDGFPANDPVNTGSRSLCVSRWGAFDMVGNVNEWVEDWVPPATDCTTALYNGDFNCLAGADATFGPAALLRGGGCLGDGAGAGVFAVDGVNQPSGAGLRDGFRCGR